MNVLYHASTNPNLEFIKPQKTMSKDKYIGEYVFATKDKTLAAMYLGPKGFGKIMNYETSSPNIMICGDQEDYIAKDKGGAIYKVDASLFSKSPQTELKDSELASEQAVKPMSKEVFDNSLLAMDEMGIKVKFIDRQTFERLSGI